MDSIYVNIGKHMREYRLSRHMTQEQVANKMAVSGNYYGKVERGTYQLSYNMLSNFYNEFNWDIDYILTGVKNEQNPFSELLERCPNNQKKDFIHLIIWAIEQKLESIKNVDADSIRKFRDKLNVIWLCSSAYSDIVEEDIVLYQIRKNVDMTNEDMAKMLNMSVRSYTWLEKGKCKPAVETIVQVDQKLGFNPSFLMTGKFENMIAVNEIWGKFSNQNQEYILHFLEHGLDFLMLEGKTKNVAQ